MQYSYIMTRFVTQTPSINPKCRVSPIYAMVVVSEVVERVNDHPFDGGTML
jgi:hypothetical protein